MFEECVVGHYDGDEGGGEEALMINIRFLLCIPYDTPEDEIYRMENLR